MKRYREYMNGIKASGTLHQRLRELEAPEKGRWAWKKYGSIAAALALVIGLGAAGWRAVNVRIVDCKVGTVAEPGNADWADIEAAFEPDIAAAPAEPGPGEMSLGGYDVVEGSGPTAMATHYVLPYIEYGAVYSDPVALDWDIPQGAIRRELPRDEIVALMGGEDAVNTHLDWGEYELSGWAAWYQDGSFWGVYINGVESVYEADSFEFAVTAGQLPPTCVVYPGTVTQEIRGLTVTADKFDWETGREKLPYPERRVSFFNGNLGCRFVVSSYDTVQAELLVSRLVCRIADEGLGVDLTDAYAEMRSGTCDVCGGEVIPGTRHFHLETYTCPDCGQTIHPGTADSVSDYDSDCPYCADGTPHTHPYDPGEHHAPAMSAPPVSVSGAPNAGSDEAMCSGYPVPPTPGPAESGDICGLPLAPSGHGEGQH